MIKEMRIEHAREISAMQSRLIQMEQNQVWNVQLRNNNNPWLKRNPPTVQRPPNPLESTNMVFQSFCRPCQCFHDEESCAIAKNILNDEFTTTREQINIFGKEFHFPLEYWMEVIENSHSVKNLISPCINNVDDEYKFCKNKTQKKLLLMFQIFS